MDKHLGSPDKDVMKFDFLTREIHKRDTLDGRGSQSYVYAVVRHWEAGSHTTNPSYDHNFPEYLVISFIGRILFADMM
ncbi:hypothetical protein ACTXT7_001446 [Hymenolepis weldensis]